MPLSGYYEISVYSLSEGSAPERAYVHCLRVDTTRVCTYERLSFRVVRDFVQEARGHFPVSLYHGIGNASYLLLVIDRFIIKNK
jgi:hypothetical protein